MTVSQVVEMRTLACCLGATSHPISAFVPSECFQHAQARLRTLTERRPGLWVVSRSLEINIVILRAIRVSFRTQFEVRLCGCPGSWGRDSGMTGSQAWTTLAKIT